MPKTETKDLLTDPPFDAKSAEVADVAQQGDAEIQTIGAEEVGKIGDFIAAGIGDALPPAAPVYVPHTSGLEQRLVDQEKALVKLASKQGAVAEFGTALEDKLSNLKAGFDELAAKIAKVGSDQHHRSSRLEEALEESVTEHHDRLLQLEMKVSRLTGEPEA